jgi:AraC-like DNA-binding protein
VYAEDKSRITKTVFQGLLARFESAVMAETFDRREDRHMTWIAMKLDEHGWREMATTLGAAFSEVEQIRHEAEERLAQSGEKPIPSTCAILGFESPSAPDRPPPPSD